MGTLLHIFWSCLHLDEFWAKVKKILQKMSDCPVLHDPAFCLLYLSSSSGKSFQRSVLRHLFKHDQILYPPSMETDKAPPQFPSGSVKWRRPGKWRTSYSHLRTARPPSRTPGSVGWSFCSQMRARPFLGRVYQTSQLARGLSCHHAGIPEPLLPHILSPPIHS